jgi:hypothetical protein
MDKVSVSFCRKRGRDVELEPIDIKVPTGSSAWRLRLRQAALDEAIARGAQQWAMPGLLHNSEDWLVYAKWNDLAGPPEFVGRYPNRIAAEMVMVHGNSD